MYELVR